MLIFSTETCKSSLVSGVLLVALFSAFVASAAAQTTTNNSASRKKKTETAASQPTVLQPEAIPSPTPPKRNERPQATPSTSDNSPEKIPARQTGQVRYRYEFSRPEFVIPHITIEHDENGSGTIEFEQRGSNESITDPIAISPKTMTKINEALEALRFLDSNESYQYEKDFSHLGNIKFSLSREGRTREVGYNWTENKDAKVLMDEYRKLGQQFVWIFDISVSRENQPLESPRLLDRLDSLIKRGEISDPHQLEPFLRELSNDERLPLIARNHAARLVARFEKEKKKGEK